MGPDVFLSVAPCIYTPFIRSCYTKHSSTRLREEGDTEAELRHQFRLDIGHHFRHHGWSNCYSTRHDEDPQVLADSEEK